ncbi:YadA-like family protein [Aggregatibacter kilianii]|uniref:YadA-like family protein n=1 Tax=Aggregatibacter kilianii TaxID=2025884 RepID=UPI000D656E00|nr:YadA-like family protein [Aggregatibacter kilianii]
MNKIFKVIWCKSSQTWVAVSELCKIKPVSSVAQNNKKSPLIPFFSLKAVSALFPLLLVPYAANAYVAIGSTDNNGYAISTGAGAASYSSDLGTPPYNYMNPGSKSYENKDQPNTGTSTLYYNGYASGVAIGNQTYVYDANYASNGIAVGDFSRATGGLAMALGTFSRAEKNGTVAIGTASRAAGVNSLAMMRQSAATGDYATAIGSVAWAAGQSSFALGASATAKGNQSIAIGSLEQKKSADGSGVPITKYSGLDNTQTNGDRSMALGTAAKTNGDDSFAIGYKAHTGEFNIEHDSYLNENIMSPNQSKKANKAIAVGTSSLAQKESSIAFGYEANASGVNAISIGANAKAAQDNVVAIGQGATATQSGSMAIGQGAQSAFKNSLALGTGTIVNHVDGGQSKFTAQNYDVGNGVISIANVGKERRIINLAAGRNDTDAVNVAQLQYVNKNLAKSISGDNYTGYSDADGHSYQAPVFNIKNTAYNNVKAAVEAAQTNYVSVNSSNTATGSNYDNKGAQAVGSIALGEKAAAGTAATNSIAIGLNANVTGNNTIALGANITAATNGSVVLGDSSSTAGSHATTNVSSVVVNGHAYSGFAGTVKDAGHFVSVGAKGNERQIKNVAAGNIAVDSTDAINGSQLFSVVSRIEQGWNISSAAATDGTVSGSNIAQTIKPGSAVKLLAGKNLNIHQNGSNFTFSTKENVSFAHVTTQDFTATGNTTVKNFTVQNGGVVNMGNNRVTGVGSPTDNTDAVNKQYVDNLKFKYAADNASKGENLLSAETTFAGTTNEIVTKAENGKISFALAENAKASLAKADSAMQGFTVGVDNAHNAAGISFNQTNKRFDIVGVNDVATKVSGNNIEVDLAQTTKDTITKHTTDIATNKNHLDKNTQDIADNKQKIADNADKITTNTQNITNNTAEIAKGFGLQAQDGNHVNKKPGEKVEVVGGNSNLNTTVDAGKIKINLNNTLDLTTAGSVAIGNTVLNSGGLTLTNGPSITTAGINAGNKSITNVTSGGDVDTNAANIADVKKAVGAVKLNFSGNKNTVGNVTLSNQTLAINGENGIETTANAQGLQVGLTQDMRDTINSKIGNNSIQLGADNNSNTDAQNLNKADGIKFNVNGDGTYVTTKAQGSAVNIDLTDSTKQKINNAANKDLSNLSSPGEKKVKDLAAWKIKTNTNAEQTVSGGETVTFKDGDNIKMTNTGKEITIATSMTPTFTSVKTGDTTLSSDGLAITGGPSINKTGINAGNNKITGVVAGTEDTDAVNYAQLKGIVAGAVSTEIVEKKAAQAGDDNLADITVANGKNAGDMGAKYEVSVSKRAVQKAVQEAIKVSGTPVISVNKTTNNGVDDYAISFNGTEAAKSIPLTYKANGNHAQTVHLNEGLNFTNGTMTVATAAANGAVTFDLNDDTKSKINNALDSNVSNITHEGKDKLADIIKVAAGANIDSVSATQDAEHNTTYTINAKSQVESVVKAVATTGDENIADVSVKTGTQGAANAEYQVGVSKNKVAEIAKGAAAWSLKVDGSTAEKISGGDTVTLKKGNNIEISKNGKEITIGTSMTPTFTKVTTDELSVGSVSINSHGINAGNQKITGVEDGTIAANSKEAVNGAQLFAQTAKAKATVENGDNNIQITPETATDGHTNYKVALNPSLTVGPKTNGHPITINGTDGYITGLTNTTWTGSPTSGRAATEDQLSAVDKKFDNKVSLGGNSGSTTEKALSDTGGIKFNIKGGDSQKYVTTTASGDDVTVDLAQAIKDKIDNAANRHLSNITDDGKKVITDLSSIVKAADGTITVTDETDNATGQKTYKIKANIPTPEKTAMAAGKNTEIEGDGSTANPFKVNLKDNLELGQQEANGVNGKDASIKVNGKDGSAVAINGKDASITFAKEGQNGMSITATRSADGKDALTLKDKDGKEGVSFLEDGRITNVADGVNDKDAVNKSQLDKSIAQAKSSVNAGKNMTITPQKNADGSTTYTVETKDEVEFTRVKSGDTTMDDNGIHITGGPSITKDGIHANNKKITGVKDGEISADSKEAVNGSQLHQTNQHVTNLADNMHKGLNLQGDNQDVTVNRQLGERLNLRGGADPKKLTQNNIGVTADKNGTMTVQLAKDVNLGANGSLTVGNTKVNNNGVAINGGPSMTNQGINAGGKQISNVARGKAPTDAVNMSQLQEVGNAINQRMDNIDNRVNKMDKRRKAGAASALASAGLMQPHRDGQSALVAAVGQYQSETAVAVGYSRISDNGKYGVKVSFSTNSQGEVGGTAGAGYFW